ncbi:mechanosensitive ion channel family protein [Motilimonas sp. KMU-193]|uniref:mechanosensitive ion channel family protein n=1 Tax=Motilimonas sp. KMU-193 TaxID=3388668 RepID=UPI00396AFAC1
MLNILRMALFGLVLVLYSASSLASDQYILADTSSPKNTFSSFMAASERLLEFWQAEQLHLPEAQHAFTQAQRTLDLSLVPNRSRTVVVMEKIILLREVIDRLALDELSHLPDLGMVTESSSRQWRFGNTDIVIQQQIDGDRAEQYLFSASSIQGLFRWYRAVAMLPYQIPERENYYELFLKSPGPLFSKQLIHSLPAEFNELYGTLPLWQWLVLVLVLYFCFTLMRLSFKLGNQWNERCYSRGVKWCIGRLLSLVCVAMVLFLTRRLIDDGIWITGGVYQFLSSAFLFGQFFFLSWFILAVFNYFSGIYIYKKHNGKYVDSSLITVLGRIFGALIIIVLGVYVVEFMGFSISPIVAGIGVGGLAVALAIRPLLENVINGLTLYADGGIKIGELCRYGEKLGTIESIGLRSTRIRTLERSLITIPNSEFANMEIDNLERRDKRRMEHVLRIRSETSLDQIRVLVVNLRRLLLQHPMIEDEPIRVRLMEVGEYSINIAVMAYICCVDNEEFMAVQEDLLFSMLNQVDNVGAKIAHSTQYQFVDKLPEINASSIEDASQIVAKWHKEEMFPFPDFSFEYKYDIKDSTVYPAKTSAVRHVSVDI